MCTAESQRVLPDGMLSKPPITRSTTGKQNRPIFTILPSSKPLNLNLSLLRALRMHIVSSTSVIPSPPITSPPQDPSQRTRLQPDILMIITFNPRTTTLMVLVEEMMKSWPEAPSPMSDLSTKWLIKLDLKLFTFLQDRNSPSSTLLKSIKLRVTNSSSLQGKSTVQVLQEIGLPSKQHINFECSSELIMFLLFNRGPYLQGIKAVIAQSYERIHRSNLVGMGILPTEFLSGQNADSLGLTGQETFNIDLKEGCLKVNEVLKVTTSTGKAFDVKIRLDTDVEIAYFLNGGILQYVLRKLVKGEAN